MGREAWVAYCMDHIVACLYKLVLDHIVACLYKLVI